MMNDKCLDFLMSKVLKLNVLIDVFPPTPEGGANRNKMDD